MKIIILVGIPGSGKSSILKEVLRQAPFVHVVNYGDKMLEEAEGVTRDLLRKMPIQDQQKLGIKAARKIAQEADQEDQITIVDTHALVRTDTGYCPGLPLEVLQILSPKVLGWVECSPSVLLQRRQLDHSRVRDKEIEEQLRTHQELISSFLAACSMFTGAALCRVLNDSPVISQNALTLVKLIQAMSTR